MRKFGFFKSHGQRLQRWQCKQRETGVPRRLTLGYSKKLANLKHSVALFVAHFNFCRVHSAHKQTPAMAAGLTTHVWNICQLFASTE